MGWIGFPIFSIVWERWISYLIFFILAWYIAVTSISIWKLSTNGCCHHRLLISIVMTLIEHSRIHATKWSCSFRMCLLFTSLKIATTRLAMKWTLRGVWVIKALVLLEYLWSIPWLLLAWFFTVLLFLLKIHKSLLLFSWWRKRFLTLFTLVVDYRLMLLGELGHTLHHIAICGWELLLGEHLVLRIKSSLSLKGRLMKGHLRKVLELLLLTLRTKLSRTSSSLLRVLWKEEVVSRERNLLSLL